MAQTATAPQAAASVPESVPEYLIKAVMIYKLSLFTNWPEESFLDALEPFRFCVLGNDPFGSYFNAIASRKVNQRDIVVTRLTKVTHARNCQVLFVSQSEENRLNRILAEIARLPILTVSDIDDFAQEGGIFQLKSFENTIRFEINMVRASQAGLSFSSRLLQLADTIIGRVEPQKLSLPSE
jgi:hypothetical protein